MNSPDRIEVLVERFVPGSTFTVDEFISICLALRQYANEGSDQGHFFEENLQLAHRLDPNTCLIRLVEEDGILFPVSESGVMTSLI